MVDKALARFNPLVAARCEMGLEEKNITLVLLSQLVANGPVDRVYYVSVREMEVLTGIKLSLEQLAESACKLAITRVSYTSPKWFLKCV